MQVPKPMYKRRKPRKRERGQVNKKQYQEALDWFGDSCSICGNTPIEMHHVTFRSQGGRGGYRNLMPLCNYHHRLAHQDSNFADELRDMRYEAFGKLYYTDRFDLHELGLIDEPTEQAFESYMHQAKQYDQSHRLADFK